MMTDAMWAANIVPNSDCRYSLKNSQTLLAISQLSVNLHIIKYYCSWNSTIFPEVFWFIVPYFLYSEMSNAHFGDMCKISLLAKFVLNTGRQYYLSLLEASQLTIRRCSLNGQCVIFFIAHTNGCDNECDLISVICFVANKLFRTTVRIDFRGVYKKW